MKAIKTITSSILVLCILLSSSLCLGVSAVKPTKELYFLIGDITGDGVVNASDARSALRVAAYIDLAPEANTVNFYAADIDEDNAISVKDARAILRIAAKLDPAPAQIEDPASKALQSPADACEIINKYANSLKVQSSDEKIGNTNLRRGFNKVEIIDTIAASAEYKQLFLKILIKNEVNAMFEEMINEPAEKQERNISSGYSNYNYYMDCLGENYVMNLEPKHLASVDGYKLRNVGNGCYEIVVRLKDGLKEADLKKIMNIPSANTFENQLGLDGDIIKFGAVTNSVKNASISYTYNPTNGKVIKAVYRADVTTSIPFDIELSSHVKYSATFYFTNTTTTTYTFAE